MTSVSTRQRSALVAVLLGLASLFIFVSIGARWLQDWDIRTGSILLPTPQLNMFALSWLLFGGFAAIALTWGISHAIADREFKPRSISDRAWLIGATALALIIPIIIRLIVLAKVPIVDDASAYQFSAELLAQGKLTAESHDARLFFDRQFMINDGRIYSQYFLGWPALMVPGVWLGIPGFMNAIYAALTVPALFLVTRRLTGSMGARVATAIYVSSPMLMASAATQMSHTSCVFALAWLTYFALRSRDEGAHWAIHFGVGVAFCVGFFIRPLSMLAAGLPLLVYWAIGAIKLEGAARIRAIAVVAIPTAGFGALFLMVNVIQNGSPMATAYGAARDYAISNGFRFSGFRGEGQTITAMRIDNGLSGFAAMAGIGLMRLSSSLFGWPISFLFAFFAFTSSRARIIWLSALSFVVFHSFLHDPGVDTFGPVHFTELAIPILILSGVGFVEIRKRLSGMRVWARAPMVGLTVLIATSVLFYSPPRLGAAARVNEKLRSAYEAPEEAGLDRALIFAVIPFTPRCSTSSNGWVFYRPNNDPDLENDILWVNHLAVDLNEGFHKQFFPDRPARILTWSGTCEPILLTFEEAREVRFEPAQPYNLQGDYLEGVKPRPPAVDLGQPF